MSGETGSRLEPVADRWLIDPLPATLHADDNPLVLLSNGTKAVLDALRARPFGATAAKLDVIRFRSKLRDYLDLAAMDQSGACSLESSLGYYCQRFGYSYPPHVLEEIIRLLDNPGTLPSDPDYENLRADALEHLHRRVPDLRDRLAEMRDISATDPLSRCEHTRRNSAHRTQATGTRLVDGGQ